MKWIEHFDVFLLDFDGLLVDSEKIHFKAYQMLCQDYGCTLTWSLNDFFRLAHTQANGISQALYLEFPSLYASEPRWEILYQKKKQFYNQLLTDPSVTQHLGLMPGVADFLYHLERLNKDRFVVTNSLKDSVDLVRKSFPILNTIPHWITREMYSRPKPYPDGYEKVLQNLDKTGVRTVGFEDSFKGLKALQEAKVETCVLICSPNHPQLKEVNPKPFYHFSSFEMITEESFSQINL